MAIIDELIEKYFQEQNWEEHMEEVGRKAARATVVAGLHVLCALKGKHHWKYDTANPRNEHKTAPETIGVLEVRGEHNEYFITPFGEEVFRRLQEEGLVHESNGRYIL